MILLFVLILGLGAGGAIGFLSCFVMLLQKYNGANKVVEQANRDKAQALIDADRTKREAKLEIVAAQEDLEKLRESKVKEAIALGLIDTPKVIEPSRGRMICGCGHHASFHTWDDEMPEDYSDCNYDMNVNRTDTTAVKMCRCEQFIEA